MERDVFSIKENRLSYDRGYAYSLQYHVSMQICAFFMQNCIGHRQIYSGLPEMWKLAVSGLENARYRAILSYRRIRRYFVLPLKAAEKQVTLVV